jgi:hypothetical protein
MGMGEMQVWQAKHWACVTEMEDDELLSCVCIFNMQVIVGRRDGKLSVRVLERLNWKRQVCAHCNSWFTFILRFGMGLQASGLQSVAQAMTVQ